MYDISAPDYWTQLAQLRGITNAVGGLHEAQRLNLKYWGAIVFDGLKWKVEVDLDGRAVNYVVRGRRAPANFKRMVGGLERSIHSMLGSEWAVIVTQNGKVTYRGTRDVVAGDTTNEQRRKRIQESGDPSQRP